MTVYAVTDDKWRLWRLSVVTSWTLRRVWCPPSKATDACSVHTRQHYIANHSSVQFWLRSPRLLVTL